VEFRPRLRLATPIVGVRRWPWGVEIRDGGGEVRRFDHVVLACHGDQILSILEDVSHRERALLGAFNYQANRAVVHGDARLMPRRRAVWSSWNYLAQRSGTAGARVSVTYWMNSLQNLPAAQDVFVSLNPLREPQPDLVQHEIAYAHPVVDYATMAAQARMGEIQGQGGVWYAGAWLGHGFHEDGIRSGVEVARELGVRPPWVEPSYAPLAGAMGLPEGAVAQPA